MNEPKSLTDKMREANELRRLTDPRIEAMVADVRLMRTEIRGLNSIGNLALGNSREAVVVSAELAARMDVMDARLNLMLERMDGMAQWAKTKGKT